MRRPAKASAGTCRPSWISIACRRSRARALPASDSQAAPSTAAIALALYLAGPEAQKLRAIVSSCLPTLPALYDVRIEGMATLAFVIQGVEFVDGRMYQQAWHCKESDEKVQVPWSNS